MMLPRRTPNKQIEFLEVRLAEVMAYADIPINMRPALTELSAHNMSGGGRHGHHAASGGAASAAATSLQHVAAGLAACGDGGGGGAGGAGEAAGVAGGIKATQVELIRGALLGCLKMLRQMSEALGEILRGASERCSWRGPRDERVTGPHARWQQPPTVSLPPVLPLPA
jgi:hypothetical protein